MPTNSSDELHMARNQILLIYLLTYLLKWLRNVSINTCYAKCLAQFTHQTHNIDASTVIMGRTLHAQDSSKPATFQHQQIGNSLEWV